MWRILNLRGWLLEVRLLDYYRMSVVLLAVDRMRTTLSKWEFQLVQVDQDDYRATNRWAQKPTAR